MKNAYRACAEIDLDALENNISQIRKKIGVLVYTKQAGLSGDVMG